MFDHFWRSERSRELWQEGSGIGLALTKRLVKAQSGRIEVESELGRGTTTDPIGILGGKIPSINS